MLINFMTILDKLDKNLTDVTKFHKILHNSIKLQNIMKNGLEILWIQQYCLDNVDHTVLHLESIIFLMINN